MMQIRMTTAYNKHFITGLVNIVVATKKMLYSLFLMAVTQVRAENSHRDE